MNAGSWVRTETPLGTAFLRLTTRGLATLTFDAPTEETDPHPASELTALTTAVTDWLSGYFAGSPPALPPLDLQGTAFQQRVWQLLCQCVPFGQTMSYLQLSRLLANEKAIRAVAAANAANPCMLLVPCHRIIGTQGELTGYAGGLWRKEWLLRHEAQYSGQAVQLGIFG